MKFFSALILVLFSFSLNATPDPNTIKIGMVYFYPPFVMSNGTGFDAQLMQLLCQRLQANCEIHSMKFKDLYQALDTGKIDIAIGGITIYGGKSDKYIYSLPYLLSKGAFLIAKDSNIDSLDALKGTKVGIIRGSRDWSVFYQYLTSNYGKQFEIEEFDNSEDLITTLDNGGISAAFTHESTALYWQLNGGNGFKTLGKFLIVGEGIGIMSSPGHEALLNAINQKILQIEKDDSYINLYQTYFSDET